MQAGRVTPEIPTKRENHIFSNCKKLIYHPMNECFKLEIKKDKLLSWYRHKYDDLGSAMSESDVTKCINLKKINN